METCILIPKELCFVLTLHSDPKNIFEMDVTIWSNCSLPSGFVFYPDDGSIHHDNIDVFTSIDKDNIRHRFGCYEEVLDIDGERVRHCNWIRFLRSSNDPSKVNLVAMKFRGQIMYQTIRPLDPNEEMVVYFDDGDDHLKVSSETDEITENIPCDMSCVDTEDSTNDKDDDSGIRSLSPQSSPRLSTSRSSSPDRKSCSSPSLSAVSPVYHLPALTECSSPREEEYHSGMSDITSVSEETSPSNEVKLHQESAFTPPPKNSISNRHSTPLSERGPLVRNRSKTWLTCEYCGKKFDRPSLLKRHERTHTGEKPHVCDVCSKAFSTSSSLNTHRRIHSGEKPHECKVCGKRFTASSNLYYHRMTHTKDKPHKCTLCSKSFPTPGDLRSHMFVHSGTWPYKCDICQRGFSKSTNLKNHMLLHDENKLLNTENGNKNTEKAMKEENVSGKQTITSGIKNTQRPYIDRLSHSDADKMEIDYSHNRLNSAFPDVHYKPFHMNTWTQPMLFSRTSVPHEHFQPIANTFPGQFFQPQMLQIQN